jgi:CheY-like chemotaxis protein
MPRAKATILCVDDHWNELIERKAMLEKNGFEVLDATSWEEGLELFLDRTVHVVILEYQLTGMNGDAVAVMMKRLKPHIPILLLSAYGPLPQKKLRAVDAFVCKSEGSRRLVSALQALLEERSKPFFYRWLEHWKVRNSAVPQ